MIITEERIIKLEYLILNIANSINISDNFCGILSRNTTRFMHTLREILTKSYTLCMVYNGYQKNNIDDTSNYIRLGKNNILEVGEIACRFAIPNQHSIMTRYFRRIRLVNDTTKNYIIQLFGILSDMYTSYLGCDHCIKCKGEE